MRSISLRGSTPTSYLNLQMKSTSVNVFIAERNSQGSRLIHFFSEFRYLVERCNYPSAVEDLLVRHRFNVGLLHGNLSDQLCRSTKLTADEAHFLARQH